MVSHFLLSSSSASPSIWGKLLFSTTDVKRSKFPRASRTKRMMTNAPKYCCCTLLLRLFHPRFWQKYQSQYYSPMANIPFLSPSFQLSEIEKRIFGAFSIFSWSTSEASSSLIWASTESSRRTHPLLFFGSKVGKLEKGGILRLLSSSTKARQLSSWRREPRKGEKKKKKGDEATGDFIEENVKLLINLICWCCCRRGCTVGKITWKSSFVIV